jgi:hypothetical protein
MLRLVLCPTNKVDKSERKSCCKRAYCCVVAFCLGTYLHIYRTAHYFKLPVFPVSQGLRKPGGSMEILSPEKCIDWALIPEVL